MNIPYFDAHCDTISLCRRDGRRLRENAGHLDLGRLGRFEKAVQFFAMFCDGGGRNDLFAEAQAQQAVFARELAENIDCAAQCRSRAEIEAANAAGKVAAVLSCEGAELLDCDPERLDWACTVGVKSINLTWNHANLLCGSHCDASERGLSDRGRAFVRRAQELGILLDVSHCSDAAFWDLIGRTEKPVIASHSNARAVCGHTRNLTDDMFRALCEAGGVVGLNFYGRFVSEAEAPSMDDAARHVVHWLELGGAKHIGLGADWDGCDALAGGLRGVQDVPLLWDALARRGCDGALLRDLFYNNWLRVME